MQDWWELTRWEEMRHGVWREWEHTKTRRKRKRFKIGYWSRNQSQTSWQSKNAWQWDNAHLEISECWPSSLQWQSFQRFSMFPESFISGILFGLVDFVRNWNSLTLAVPCSASGASWTELSESVGKFKIWVNSRKLRCF